MLEVLFWLLVAHAVGDFALQSDWMARHKSRHTRETSVLSDRPEWIWVHVLSAHAMIHGGAVALATGSIVLGLLEFVAHWIIDFCKGEKIFGFHTDQALHLSCKLAWWLLLLAGVV